ncbi:hypothetical protein H6S82_07320 [Planktothrix sp. FACHB-1355]|nr:hypothetical protein [Planktothrix sp. FACHB-1355]
MTGLLAEFFNRYEALISLTVFLFAKKIKYWQLLKMRSVAGQYEVRRIKILPYPSKHHPDASSNDSDDEDFVNG